MSFTDLLDPQKIIVAFGLIGIISIIFIETGLFFGFFFPGDSLLFTAGFFASQDLLPLSVLLFGTFLAAIVGDSVGYWTGKKVGPALFTREDSLFFKKKYISDAQHFYEKYGKKTIILARFVPIIRTFAPIVAGIGNMQYRIFITYNIIGAFIWTFGITLLGYFLGKTIPNVDKYLIPIIIFIVLTSFIPAIAHLFKKKV